MSDWKDGSIAAVLGWSVLVASALILVGHSAVSAESGETIGRTDSASALYLAYGLCPGRGGRWGMRFSSSARFSSTRALRAQASNATAATSTSTGADSKSAAASTASAASAATQSPPAAFNRCKACHGDDARGRGSIGPDLTLSELTLDQWIMQTRFGSKWDGKPPKRKGFEKRIMTKQMVSDEEVKEIYEWVKGSR